MKTFLNFCVIITFFSFVVLSCNEARQNNPGQQITDNSQFNIDTLRGYSVLYYEKEYLGIEGNSPFYFKGVAANCDGLGVCDSINFTSRWEPRMALGRFVASSGKENSWMLIKQ